ncbi:MAG TPA: adenosylcobinamide-GDP ribazoletransferase [Alphaproteobacteria bacterium]|nr:adenosylcobinamide-GDP ribazoletransferase [Alphaproteobacteria bacterium]
MPDTSPTPPITRTVQPVAAPLLSWGAEVRLALAFLTRLPVSLPSDSAAQPVGAAVRAFPLVGVVVGLTGAAVYAVADLLGMSATVSALLAIGAMVILTGGLHEDGLADSADGLGGTTREQALAIMRDSRIGTFGVMALFFVLSLRVVALSYAGSTVEAVCLLIAAAAGSRAAIPALMHMLPPARRDGLGWSAGQPDRRRVVDAGALGALVVVLMLWPVWGLLAITSAAAAAALVGWLARRRLGGQTGDVLGAAQQLAETAILLSYVAAPTWI